MNRKVGNPMHGSKMRKIIKFGSIELYFEVNMSIYKCKQTAFEQSLEN